MKCLNPYRGQFKKGFELQSLPFGAEAFLDFGCGKCAWCRIQRRREWSIRIAQESDYWEDKHFITLTYGEKVPTSPMGLMTLRPDDTQLFYKRLRKKLDKEKIKIKHFTSGEYGDPARKLPDGTWTQGHRPHYHAIVFGNPDEKAYTECWNQGNVHVGSVTPDSIMYTTKYVSKKLYGDEAELYYDREPEFQRGSQGLGLRYLEDNLDKILHDGYVMYKGKKQNIPRYYLKKIKEMKCNDKIAKFELERKKKAAAKKADLVLRTFECTPDMLHKTELRQYVDDQRRKEAKQMALRLKNLDRIKEGKRRIRL